MNFRDRDAVIKELKNRDNFLITSHVKPEGDSIGSQLAVFFLLERIGKKAVIVDQDVVPENLKFLPSSEYISSGIPDGFQPEVAVFLDCPVRERAGKVIRSIDESIFTVNIDHHVSNEYYGDISWVESGMSSVGEMIYHMVKELGVEIDDALRQAIYTAIITDTGIFNYDNTSGETHRVVGDLIDLGIDPRIMHSRIFEEKTTSGIRILGKVLSTLKTEGEGLLAHISLSREMLKEEGLENVSTEDFINYPRSIKGVEVAVFFNEGLKGPDAINISFRSNNNVDVNRIASVFGGGGHKKASGCFLECSMEAAKEKVLAEVMKVIKESL